MDQFIKVAGTEGKVGGYFCRLLPLNQNTVLRTKLKPTFSEFQLDQDLPLGYTII